MLLYCFQLSFNCCCCCGCCSVTYFVFGCFCFYDILFFFNFILCSHRSIYHSLLILNRNFTFSHQPHWVIMHHIYQIHFENFRTQNCLSFFLFFWFAKINFLFFKFCSIISQAIGYWNRIDFFLNFHMQWEFIVFCSFVRLFVFVWVCSICERQLNVLLYHNWPILWRFNVA